MTEKQLTGAERRARRMFGVMLMVVGGMMAALCGLCSLSVLSSGGEGGFVVMLPVVMVFGGIPIWAGVALFFMGLGRWRND